MGKPLTIDLDDDLMLRLQQQAEARGMPLERLVTEALQRLIRAQEKKQRIIDEALAEAEKGRFISSEAMTAWFESLGTENELPPPEPDVFIERD